VNFTAATRPIKRNASTNRPRTNSFAIFHCLLRVLVKPHAAESFEVLTYVFDDIKPGSAAATLRWENVESVYRSRLFPNWCMEPIAQNQTQQQQRLEFIERLSSDVCAGIRQSKASRWRGYIPSTVSRANWFSLCPGARLAGPDAEKPCTCPPVIFVSVAIDRILLT